MDFAFFAFVLAIALMTAVGAVMLLVGYIVVIPASITRGWWWAALVVFLPIFGPIFFCRAFPGRLAQNPLADLFWHTAPDGSGRPAVWRRPLDCRANG